jgi:heme/copper-type cytochrome/quinol oxidase subunit 2
MNLEMPTPTETEGLRKALLVVLGVMIVTIPVIGVLVVAKIKANQRNRERRPAPPPAGNTPNERTKAARSPDESDHEPPPPHGCS